MKCHSHTNNRTGTLSPEQPLRVKQNIMHREGTLLTSATNAIGVTMGHHIHIIRCDSQIPKGILKLIGRSEDGTSSQNISINPTVILN